MTVAARPSWNGRAPGSSCVHTGRARSWPGAWWPRIAVGGGTGGRSTHRGSPRCLRRKRRRARWRVCAWSAGPDSPSSSPSSSGGRLPSWRRRLLLAHGHRRATVSHRSDLGHDPQRRLLGAATTEVEADGAVHPSQLLVSETLLAKGVETILVGLA